MPFGCEEFIFMHLYMDSLFGTGEPIESATKENMTKDYDPPNRFDGLKERTKANVTEQRIPS